MLKFFKNLFASPPIEEQSVFHLAKRILELEERVTALEGENENLLEALEQCDKKIDSIQFPSNPIVYNFEDRRKYDDSVKTT